MADARQLPDPQPREWLRTARHMYTYEHKPEEAIAAALIGLLALGCEWAEASARPAVVPPPKRKRWWQR